MSVKARRWAEFLGGFFILPLAFGAYVPPSGWIPGLWAAALLCWLLLRAERSGEPFWGRPDKSAEKKVCGVLLVRFVIIAVAFALAVRLLMPDRFLNFPRRNFGVWLLVVFIYPWLSVLPQEFIYRRFFFQRFAALFPSPRQLSLVSALMFSWLHLIFHNPFAVGLTLIGGWFFAETYRRSGSLRLACLEHAFYGTLVFTAGLGHYIYHGAVRWH